MTPSHPLPEALRRAAEDLARAHATDARLVIPFTKEFYTSYLKGFTTCYERLTDDKLLCIDPAHSHYDFLARANKTQAESILDSWGLESFMTLPFERARAIENVREFLRSLLDPKQTPRVPKEIRRQARWALKHFPTALGMSQLPKNKVFSHDED